MRKWWGTTHISRNEKSCIYLKADATVCWVVVQWQCHFCSFSLCRLRSWLIGTLWRTARAISTGPQCHWNTNSQAQTVKQKHWAIDSRIRPTKSTESRASTAWVMVQSFWCHLPVPTNPVACNSSNASNAHSLSHTHLTRLKVNVAERHINLKCQCPLQCLLLPIKCNMRNLLPFDTCPGNCSTAPAPLTLSLFCSVLFWAVWVSIK